MSGGARAMRTKQQGFSLLEGLLATLIFSVGILALVSLQAAAVKEVGDAKYRVDASYLANEIIAQMWADDHTTATLQSRYNTGGPQYQAWAAEVQAALPNGINPTISIDGNNIATVTVLWQPPGAATQHSFAAMAQIR